jgi:acetyltransferase
VVLKALKADLLHKSRMGGVEVGLETEAAVSVAMSRLLLLAPEQILVQKEIAGGDEWLVGVIRDPDYGPLVTVGAGGTRAEIWRDVEQRLAPLSPADLDALLERPRFSRTLEGVAGRSPGDRAALRDVVDCLASMACEHPGIEEMEINPLLVQPAGHGASAVDVRVRLGAAVSH